jgi:hypothetical protein
VGAFDLGHACGHVDSGDHGQTDEATLARGTELDQPVVVGLNARQLVIAVLRLRDLHAH